jgi:glycosyltransferase involved in cell wall biosynthesis
MFEGSVDNDQLGGFYSKASICVLPSLWMENCPIAGLEALVYGRALVGSDIGGIPDLIKDGVNGFLVMPNDHELLARRVIKILENRELLTEFSAHSRRLYKTSFTERIHMERLSKLYHDLDG